VIDFSRKSVLSFDCYGTIIDWEAGIVAAVRPILSAHGLDIADEQVLELYAALESAAEAGPYRRYADILADVMRGLGERLGFTPSPTEADALAASVGNWPPFADSAEALATLKRRFKLAIISNIDDDLFAASQRHLGVEFEWIVTAQQARSYKPSLNNFRVALERIGLPRDQVLHVAQSLFHDHVPARQLGLDTVWVNRRGGKRGGGATPPADAQPDLEVPDLRTLADLAVLEARPAAEPATRPGDAAEDGPGPRRRIQR
jgi:2-haloacid dehalogenase